MAYVLLGRTRKDEVVLVSTDSFAARSSALSALNELAAEPGSVPDDVEVVLVDLDAAAPVVFVRSTIPAEAPDEAAEPAPPVESVANVDVVAEPESERTIQLEFEAAPVSAGPEPESPATPAVPEIAANVQDVSTDEDGASIADTARAEEAEPVAQAAAKEDAPVPGIAVEPRTTVDEESEPPVNDAARMTALARFEADLARLLVPRDRTPGEDAADESSAARKPTVIDKPTVIEAPAAPEFAREIVAELVDEPPEEAAPVAVHAEASEVAEPAAEAVTAIASWPWQRPTARKHASVTKAEAAAAPKPRRKRAKAPRATASATALIEAPAVEKQVGPDQNRELEPRPAAGEATTTKLSPVEESASSSPDEVEALIIKLGSASDSLPPDLVETMTSEPPPPTSFGSDLADLTCEDCVYVETCPHTGEKTPTDCGLFQWRPS